MENINRSWMKRTDNLTLGLARETYREMAVDIYFFIRIGYCLMFCIETNSTMAEIWQWPFCLMTN